MATLVEGEGDEIAARQESHRRVRLMYFRLMCRLCAQLLCGSRTTLQAAAQICGLLARPNRVSARCFFSLFFLFFSLWAATHRATATHTFAMHAQAQFAITRAMGRMSVQTSARAAAAGTTTHTDRRQSGHPDSSAGRVCAQPCPVLSVRCACAVVLLVCSSSRLFAAPPAITQRPFH